MRANTRTVELREFVDLAVTRIEAAGERGDLEEAARLLYVLRDAVDDAARVITRQIVVK